MLCCKNTCSKNSAVINVSELMTFCIVIYFSYTIHIIGSSPVGYIAVVETRNGIPSQILTRSVIQLF